MRSGAQLLVAEVLVEADAELGEGPVWDDRRGQVVWVDFVGRHIHLSDPATGETRSLATPLEVGAVALRERGGFVAALADGFYILDDDGASTRLAAVEDNVPGNRMNDGKCDPAGRFWAGTMAYDAWPGAGSLYRLDPDGAVERVLEGVTISNGIGWSPDAQTMYYVDTPTQRLDAFDFDLARGRLGRRRKLVDIPPEAGAPDGLTVDAEGGIWVCLWGGGTVHRYLADGQLDRVVRVPAAQVTSCTFGGPQLDELFITTAWQGLSEDQRRQQPNAGSLFRVRPRIRGVSSDRFAG